MNSVSSYAAAEWTQTWKLLFRVAVLPRRPPGNKYQFSVRSAGSRMAADAVPMLCCWSWYVAERRRVCRRAAGRRPTIWINDCNLYLVRRAGTGSQLTTEANIIRCRARPRELHLLRRGAAAAGDDDKDEDAVAKVG